MMMVWGLKMRQEMLQVAAEQSAVDSFPVGCFLSPLNCTCELILPESGLRLRLPRDYRCSNGIPNKKEHVVFKHAKEKVGSAFLLISF